MKIRKKQLTLLRKLDRELEGGAHDQLETLLKQLEGELAEQKLDRLCETSDSVTQLVNYTRSFEGRDDELKFTYRNATITDANFKAEDVLKPFETGTATREFRVYHSNQHVSSEKMISFMKKDGYRPATALELLEYYVAQLLQSTIVRWFSLFALGSVWNGRVVNLNLGPSHRNLNLDAFYNSQVTNCEFLAVRETEQA